MGVLKKSPFCLFRPLTGQIKIPYYVGINHDHSRLEAFAWLNSLSLIVCAAVF